MREGLVRFRHSVRVFLLLDRAAGIVERVHKLCCELFAHFALAPLSRVDDDPTDRKRLTALGTDLDRNLIVRTAYATGFDLQNRLMSFATTLLPYTGSGNTSLFGTLPLLGIFLSSFKFKFVHEKIFVLTNIFSVSLRKTPPHALRLSAFSLSLRHF